jgi:type II secretory pathway pseudopilin PulG
MRYEAECVNAREANKQIAAREEAQRREEFEKQSERKRQALRRAQEAAATARRRAEEERRLLEEQEYLAQFGELPPQTETSSNDVAGGNEPIVVLPEPDETQPEVTVYDEPAMAPQTAPLPSDEHRVAPADQIDNAPAVESDASGDLDAIREELRRRNEGSQ